MSFTLEPVPTTDAHAYWRVFLAGRGDVPPDTLQAHLDRYLALPPEEQRRHFAMRLDGRIVGTVRLSPGSISGFSMDPAHADRATPFLVKAVDLLRAQGASEITASFEDRYEAHFEAIGFRRHFARIRMEAPTARRDVPSGWVLKPPEETEVLGLTRFLQDAYDGHMEQAFGMHVGSDEEWREYVGELFKGGAGRFMPDASFVALDGARMTGAILITEFLKMPLVAELGVSKDVRGRGLGRALLQASVNRLVDLGAPRVSLYVTVGNDPAIRLYERTGFVQVGGEGVTARLA